VPEEPHLYTYDHHVRQAIIGVLAFLITPGFLFPLQLSGAFEFAAIRFPAMLDPLIRLVTTIYWTGTRAAMQAFLVPPTLLLTVAVTAPLLGVRVAMWHAAFVTLMLMALIELAALTIDALPFTHPYRPGHAKLKSRWPVYVLGILGFAYWPVRAELSALGGGEASLLAWPAAAALVFHLAGRRARATVVDRTRRRFWRGRRQHHDPGNRRSPLMAR
jgi:hypothetical protein